MKIADFIAGWVIAQIVFAMLTGSKTALLILSFGVLLVILVLNSRRKPPRSLIGQFRG